MDSRFRAPPIMLLKSEAGILGGRGHSCLEFYIVPGRTLVRGSCVNAFFPVRQKQEFYSLPLSNISISLQSNQILIIYGEKNLLFHYFSIASNALRTILMLRAL